MSIFPATDIVADAARAADPRKAALAMKRLTDIAGSRGAEAPAFASLVKPQTHPTPSLSISGHVDVKFSSVTHERQEAKTPAAVAAQKFEAYVLQMWLETLLPKTEGGSYGSGAGGDIWRSMMAEQLGTQLSKAGGVGLRRLFDKTHELTAASRDLAEPHRAA